MPSAPASSCGTSWAKLTNQNIRLFPIFVVHEKIHCLCPIHLCFEQLLRIQQDIEGKGHEQKVPSRCQILQ